jgi:signal transduction histidine kinase
VRAIKVRSAMLVPLVAREQTIGVIAFFTSSSRPYGTEDLRLAQELATRAALAIDNARLYREAREALQARDDVLAVVSHDLGNPLSAIRIGTSLLLRAVPEEERGKGGWAHLEGIRHSTEQMERLVNDLLEIKRIEAGHLALRSGLFSAATLVHETVELFQPIARSRNITLEHFSDAPDAVVRCDRERLLQVFSNLVGNALKFTPEGGRVEARVMATSSEVIFSVSDTGPGIEPQNLEFVFDRFWRAQRNKREGIGLGLAIAKGIVQAHGGRIWAESEVGVGSTFRFALPTEAAVIEERDE